MECSSRSYPYSTQMIDEDDIKAVVDVLRSDYLTQGPMVEAFETKLAAYCGAKYAVVFNSGTAALHAAYSSLGLGPNDRFITSPITFAATANAGLLVGAKPVFADVELETGNMDASVLEGVVDESVKLIVPVHYAGRPADMVRIKRVANRYNIPVVEDACHALGATYHGSKVGACEYSDAAVFSFHPVKPIATGEGGAILTNRSDIYEYATMLRTHGIRRNPEHAESKGQWFYEMVMLGNNYRMTDIQAALGASQLEKVDRFTRRRMELSARYRDIFSDEGAFSVLADIEDGPSSNHLFPILLNDALKVRKREIFSSLRGRGLGVQVHYVPVYQHPYYREHGYGDVRCDRAEDFYQRVLSIPLYVAMSDEDQDAVVDVLRDVMGRCLAEKG